MIRVVDATESVLSGGERSHDTCRRCYGKCVIIFLLNAFRSSILRAPYERLSQAITVCGTNEYL